MSEARIFNILYPRVGARDDEVERLDDVLLHAGDVCINRCLYRLSPYSPPEYTRYPSPGQSCASVTYRWFLTPLIRK